MYVICTPKREIYHFGVKRRSGRYPYGSGERPYQDRESSKMDKRNNIKKNIKTTAKILATSAAIAYSAHKLDDIYQRSNLKRKLTGLIIQGNKEIQKYANDLGLNEVQGFYTLGFDALKRTRSLWRIPFVIDDLK